MSCKIFAVLLSRLVLLASGLLVGLLAVALAVIFYLYPPGSRPELLLAWALPPALTISAGHAVKRAIVP